MCLKEKVGGGWGYAPARATRGCWGGCVNGWGTGGRSRISGQADTPRTEGVGLERGDWGYRCRQHWGQMGDWPQLTGQLNHPSTRTPTTLIKLLCISEIVVLYVPAWTLVSPENIMPLKWCG